MTDPEHWRSVLYLLYNSDGSGTLELNEMVEMLVSGIVRLLYSSLSRYFRAQYFLKELFINIQFNDYFTKLERSIDVKSKKWNGERYKSLDLSRSVMKENTNYFLLQFIALIIGNDLWEHRPWNRWSKFLLRNDSMLSLQSRHFLHMRIMRTYMRNRPFFMRI